MSLICIYFSLQNTYEGTSTQFISPRSQGAKVTFWKKNKLDAETDNKNIIFECKEIEIDFSADSVIQYSYSQSGLSVGSVFHQNKLRKILVYLMIS